MLYLGEDCEDANSKKSVNRIKKLSPIEFDLMARKVLLECRDAQQGKLSMPRWGLSWEIQHFDSFQDRFDCVKSSLRTRKSMVANCFDNVFSKRMVANPDKETKLKNANKNVNSKKAENLDLAKRVRQTGQGAHNTPQESPEDVQADVGDQTRPAKAHGGMAAESKVTAGVGSGLRNLPTPDSMLDDSDLIEATQLDQRSLDDIFQDEEDRDYSIFFNARMV